MATSSVNQTHSLHNTGVSTPGYNWTLADSLNGTDDLDQILEELNLMALQRMYPVYIYVGLLSLIGFLGNLHVILIYSLKYNRSNHRCFIICLAIIDLLACALFMPFKLLNMRYTYTFEAVAPCKIFRFLNVMSAIGSGLILFVIGIDRYRKICRPLGPQWRVSSSRRACAVAVFAAVAISFPCFLVYGQAEIPTPIANITGTGCDYLYDTGVNVTVYKGAQFLLFVSVITALSVVYAIVGRTLFKAKRFRQTYGNRPNSKRKDEIELSARGSPKSSEIGGDSTGSSSRPSLSEKRANSAPLPTVSRKSKAESSRSSAISREDASTRRITLMLLTTTVVSVASFLPHLTIMVVKSLNKESELSASSSSGAAILTEIGMRSYFINSMANPLIYGFWDPKFRRELQALYHNLFCRKKAL